MIVQSISSLYKYRESLKTNTTWLKLKLFSFCYLKAEQRFVNSYQAEAAVVTWSFWSTEEEIIFSVNIYTSHFFGSD